MNSRRGLAGLMIALLAVTACGTTVSGVARRASTTSVSATGSPPGGVTGSTSRTADPSEFLERTDPCTLVTRAEAEGALGTLRQEPLARRLGTATTCAFSPRTATFILAIRTNVGLAGVLPNGGTIKEITVGDRPAKELPDASTGSCGVYLGVTEQSRVDVVVNATSSGEDPCPIALRVAQWVEPRLP
ncbi:DUF3558 domain-containing protein [Actinosynnema sp. CS-041913]|uniref:DUF3558 domain-containing protein n=1 Tax=Actinosynnema sp. CS-041913 TaxID=3239917 RepID=UPI003D8B2F4E